MLTLVTESANMPILVARLNPTPEGDYRMFRVVDNSSLLQKLHQLTNRMGKNERFNHSFVEYFNRVKSEFVAIPNDKQILIYLTNGVDTANKLAVVTHNNSFLANYDSKGILSNLDRVSHEILQHNNLHNLRLIPVRNIKDPLGDYWEYKLIYIGDRLELNSVKDGVRYADHCFGRHDVSIFGNFPVFKTKESSNDSTLTEFLTSIRPNASWRSGEYEKYNKIYSFVGETKEDLTTDSLLPTDYTLITDTVRKNIAGKVRMCAINTPWKKLSNRTDGSWILEDYVKFKELLRQPKNSILNPELDLDILNLHLVKLTLTNIVKRCSLIIPDTRFYRQLQHLGLILDRRDLNSTANFFHVTKLLKTYHPERVVSKTYLTLTVEKENIEGMFLMGKLKSDTCCLITESKSTVHAELLLRNNQVEGYVNLAKQFKCEIKQGV